MDDDEEDLDLFFCALIYLLCLSVPFLAVLVYPDDAVYTLIPLFWPIPSLAYLLIYRNVRKNYKGENKKEVFHGRYPTFATVYYHISIVILLITLYAIYSFLESRCWPG